MIVTFNHEGGFKKTIGRLLEIRDSNSNKALNRAGSVGVKNLQHYTPKDTGETAVSWDYNIKQSMSGPVLNFYNNAHPELRVNIALLIQLGHGTGTGGYVSPVEYMRPAMEKTIRETKDDIWREMSE